MQLLSDFDGTDLISEVLRSVRVRSTVYCHSSMGAPWGFGVRAHGNPAFHVVTEGSCWLSVDGETGEIALAAGDLVVLPAGPRHWMRDDPATVAVALEDILAATPPAEHHRLRHGGPGPRTGLLCGGFGLDGGTHPILRALPAVVVVRGAGGRPVPWLDALLALLNEETATPSPGAEEVVTRLADALLTQALRGALAELQADGNDGLLASRDPQVAAAIELIHRRPAHAWTVTELAAQVALSRSAFSARFTGLIGESPKRYVTHTRLVHAATLLRSNNTSIAEVALKIGYSSEFSFAKAFKRTFGVSPGSYRGQAHGVPGLGREPGAALPAP
jgi:AraC-like DNA-binding protein/mannose-6-phosphate isomerase-like protein (cupin superfamily)